MKNSCAAKSIEDIQIIKPTTGWRNLQIGELWHFRELLYFLTWRDIKVRYKQTLVGILWALLQPFLTMVVFSLFFGRLAGISSEGAAYPVFVYIGLLPWTLFSQSLTRSSESVVLNANLVKKVYFPRVIIPLSASLSAVVDFLWSFLILIFMMVYYRIVPSALILWLPFLVLLTCLCSVGIGFWLSAINVMYRDVRYCIPFLIQTGMFVTPVIYPVTIVPDRYAWLLYFNPMTGIIEMYRAVLLGHKGIPWFRMGLSIGLTLLFFITGAFFFKKMERKFADVV